MIKSDTPDISHESNRLFQGIDLLIAEASNKMAIFLNSESNLLCWSIGNFINTELKEEQRLA